MWSSLVMTPASHAGNPEFESRHAYAFLFRGGFFFLSIIIIIIICVDTYCIPRAGALALAACGFRWRCLRHFARVVKGLAC